MKNYLIGDIHGCNFELQNLLKKIHFNSKKDILWITGDLVSRGPNSIEVLRFLYSIKDRVKIVLGNHEIHLLATYYGIKNIKNNDFNNLLQEKDIDILIHWIQNQNFMQIDEKKKLIMTHAGITPQWDLNTAIECAQELQNELSSRKNCISFLKETYESEKIKNWNKNFKKKDRISFSINVFTKMRYCFQDGSLNMKFKKSPYFAPSFLKPWFSFKNHIILQNYNIAFGHWASLKNYKIPNNVFPLDTGCCWGGKLTLMDWKNKKFFRKSSKKI